jgi:hypothetical protein
MCAFALSSLSSPLNRHSTQYQSTNPFLPQSDVYRYGFQGQEIQQELIEFSVNYNHRSSNALLGRFFDLDPIFRMYAYNSPYSFSENRVIDSKEREGLEKVEYWVNGKCISSFNWHEVDYNTKEAFLRKHDIEGSFGIDYHPNDDAFSGGTQSEVWRFYSTYCDGMTGMVMYKFANEDAARNGESSSHKLFSGLLFDLASFSRSLEGSDDGANTGGKLGGKDGWDNGGKQLVFGTISVVTAPISIAAGGVYSLMGSFSLANGIDDMFTNEQRESLTQQLVSDPNYKELIGNIKTGGTIVTCIGGGYQLWKLGTSGYATGTEVAPTLLATGNDLNAIIMQIKTDSTDDND